MKYRKTNRTRQTQISQTRKLKPRYNKQAMSWHEQMDREMMARINREEAKYFLRTY